MSRLAVDGKQRTGTVYEDDLAELDLTYIELPRRPRILKIYSLQTTTIVHSYTQSDHLITTHYQHFDATTTKSDNSPATLSKLPT